jgi:hypothetical protein
MNGNDYLELEEEHSMEIEQDYIQAIREGTETIPAEYVEKWIDLWRQ